MRKSLVSGFLAGSLLFGAAGVFAYFDAAEEAEKIYATPLEAVVNPFPVKLNGKDVDIAGYNIDGNTYFKLRDVSELVGGFNVDFYNNRILLSEGDYKYDLTQAPFNSVPDDRIPRIIFKDDAYSVASDWAYQNIIVQPGNRLSMFEANVFTAEEWNSNMKDNKDIYITYASEIDSDGNLIRRIVMQVDKYTAEVSIIDEIYY